MKVVLFVLKNADLFLQSCDEQNIAKKVCDECEEYLCDDCVKAHKRVKYTKDHSITDIDVGHSTNAEAESGNEAVTKDIPCSVHQVRYSFEDKGNCICCVF